MPPKKKAKADMLEDGFTQHAKLGIGVDLLAYCQKKCLQNML